MPAPASRQRAASAPISAALTGKPGCACLVVSAPTPATVMISLSICDPLLYVERGERPNDRSPIRHPAFRQGQRLSFTRVGACSCQAPRLPLPGMALGHVCERLLDDVERPGQVGLGVPVADVPVMIGLHEQAATDAL